MKPKEPFEVWPALMAAIAVENPKVARALEMISEELEEISCIVSAASSKGGK